MRVREQSAAGYDFLKIHPGLSREEFIAIANAAREVGIPIAGHVSWQTGLDTALAEKQACIDHLDAYAEALVPPDSPLSGIAPEWFGLNLVPAFDVSRIDTLATQTALAGVWNAPTQSLFETTVGALSLDELLARPGMDMLSEGLRATWISRVRGVRADVSESDRATFLDARRALIKALQDAGAGLLLGSDAPQIMNVPGYSTHQELAWLVGAGLTPLQALQSGTINVARYFDEDHHGQVAPGFVADLVLLTEDPLQDIGASNSIQGVMQGGRWFDRAALNGLLDGVRRLRL
jgi:imidazolonepropionase-like amidohydrolase